VEVAFRTWTERIDAWWPRGHSRSGNPDTAVFIESRVGGRIYERTPDGVEHNWGAVIAWDPPRHFAYYWYLGSSLERPTRVDVSFTVEPGGNTRVEVNHRGPELIGELWSRNSPRYDGAWEAVLPAYSVACGS
jgi:Activator of Hsp90 ATPase homolog 1-like protein